MADTISEMLSEAGVEFAERRRKIRYGISEETRKSRVKLLIVATISAAVALTGKTPTKIPALGVVLDAGHSTLFVVGLILFHSLVLWGFIRTKLNDHQGVQETHEALLLEIGRRHKPAFEKANSLTGKKQQAWVDEVKKATASEKKWTDDAINSFGKRFLVEVAIPLWYGVIALALLVTIQLTYYVLWWIAQVVT